jgi:hypothetical protein
LLRPATTNGRDHAGKLNQDAIAGGIDDPAMFSLNERGGRRALRRNEAR